MKNVNLTFKSKFIIDFNFNGLFKEIIINDISTGYLINEECIIINTNKIINGSFKRLKGTNKNLMDMLNSISNALKNHINFMVID